MSRKRHKLISRPIAGAKIRYERWSRGRRVLLDVTKLREAWLKPFKPFKHVRKGWVRAPLYKGHPEMMVDFKITLEWEKPDA